MSLIPVEDSVFRKKLKKACYHWWRRIKITFKNKIPQGDLGNITTINLRNFNNKPIKNIKGISNFYKVKYLDIKWNDIEIIPDEIEKLQRLKILDLTWNKISSLPETIKKINNLKDLLLHSNNFSEIPKSILKIRRLQDLWFAYNNLSILPSELFTKKTGVAWRYLDFSGNYNLSKMELPSTRLDNLEFLNLWKCRLQKIPNNIGKAKKIKKIYLNDNSLKKLPNTIWNCSLLQTLHLSKNNLQYLPLSFKKLKNLRQLILKKNNKLNKIADHFSETQATNDVSKTKIGNIGPNWEKFTIKETKKNIIVL